MMKTVKLLTIALLLAGCKNILSSDSSVHFEATIKNATIENIEDLKASFHITNNSDEEVEFSFSSSCQRAFRIKQDGQILLDSRKFFGCLTVITSLKLAPGEIVTYSINLDKVGSYMQKELDSIKPGTYQLEMFLRNDQSPKISRNFRLK
ncbi:MAG TPA: BsuPI-related putative proteinase inhibitor [Balneolaceae bacterium]